MNQPRKNPDPVILSVRIDRKLLERLDQFGSRTGLTRAETVSEALDAKLPAKGSRTSPALPRPMEPDVYAEINHELSNAFEKEVLSKMLGAPMLLPDGRCAFCGTTHVGDCPPSESKARGLVGDHEVVPIYIAEQEEPVAHVSGRPIEPACEHPKESLKHLAYGTFCMACNRKVR